MNSYLSRYQAGECVEVWRELSAMGGRVWEPSVVDDAWAVAQELVRRCLANLQHLRLQLDDLGYRFENPSQVIVEADNRDKVELNELEAAQGRLPMVLRAWYEMCRRVDFRQAADQLRGEGGQTAISVSGLGMNPVLLFLPISEAVALQARLREERLALGREPDTTGIGSFLPLGAWASNSEPKGVVLPAAGIDGVYYNEGFGDVTFVDELRLAFKWGGFPFWRGLVERPRRLKPVGVSPEFPDLLGRLVEDLMLA